MAPKTIADRNREVREHLLALGADCYRLSPLKRFANEGQLTDCGTLITPRNHFKHPLVLSARGIVDRLSDLRRRNAGGADIVVAIHDNPPGVILLDDITLATLPEVRKIAVPRATVQTSKGSYQCWMAVPKGVDALQFSRGVARIVGADPGGVGAHQGGKLAGFTNQKPIRRLPSGDGPWIDLLQSSPEAPPPPDETVERILEAGSASRTAEVKRPTGGVRATSARGHESSVAPDRSQSGRDFALACRTIEQGGTVDDVVKALEQVSDARGKWSGYARKTALAAWTRVMRKRGISGR